MSAETAVDAIIKDLRDRRGLKGEWEQIDPDIVEEIRETWIEIVRAEATWVRHDEGALSEIAKPAMAPIDAGPQET